MREREGKRERRKETEVERKRVAVWNNKARKQRKEEAIGLLAVQVQILSFFISQKKNQLIFYRKSNLGYTRESDVHITTIPAYLPVNMSCVLCQNDFKLCILK